MKLTQEQCKEMLEVSKPLMKWLNNNCHPHVKAIVENDRVELLEGVAMSKTDKFIKECYGKRK